MKKVILSVLVVGSLMATSCKKAKEEAKDAAKATENVVSEGANAVKEGAEKTVEGAKEVVADAKATVAELAIPDFGNEAVNNYAKSYAEYANEYIAAKGDVLKNGLGEKGAKLATQAQEIMGKLDADGTKKFGEFMAQLQTKMVEATKK